MSDKNIRDLLAEEAEDVESRRPSGHRLYPSRPAKEPAQVYSIRLPADVLERLRREAADVGTTPSGLMRSWVLERLGKETRTLVEAAARTTTLETTVNDLAERLISKLDAEIRHMGRRDVEWAPRLTDQEADAVIVITSDAGEGWRLHFEEHLAPFATKDEALAAAHSRARGGNVIVYELKRT